MTNTTFSFQEFFAGGGMVRQALGGNWKCTFANDFDGKKALAYQDNWGLGGELLVGDIRKIMPSQLDTCSDLSWASFPCQDLSLAGAGKGLASERSGMFFIFWEKLRQAAIGNALPKIVVIENVCGMLTSNQGRDFRAVIKTFVEHGYKVGGLIIDAKDFVPQSRKRVFIIGVRDDHAIESQLISSVPISDFHTPALIRAYDQLTEVSKANWVWFNLPRPSHRKTELIGLLEPENEVDWNDTEKTALLLSKMSAVNRSKVQAAQNLNYPAVGALFMRTRTLGSSKKVFAEVRFDGISGCLRTPNGGSSRQSILWVEGAHVRSRLLTPRETARLMGLPDAYKLPKNKNAALHLTGDGVVVPVVEHLKNYLLEPLISSHKSVIVLNTHKRYS